MAIQFDTKPEGWKSVGQPYQRLYTPIAKQKELWDRIKALPTVSINELNTILGFERFVGITDDGGMVAFRAPGMHWVDSAFLIEVPTNSDFVEILESEYQRLAETKPKKKKAATA
jgi:hypothetical protein